VPNNRFRLAFACGLVCVVAACADHDHDSAPAGADAGAAAVSGETASPLTYRADVAPVTDPAAAMPGVFIPPFLDCRDSQDGKPGEGPDGKVCTHVAISGCTEAGRYFPDYADCAVVRTQRPFWVEAPANEPDPDDPRLDDPAFMGELAWMTQQLEASACTCCHDSRVNDGKTGQWDIHHGPIWLDTLSDDGLALFIGLADSSALGAYPADDNHGFDRTQTGVPTNDTARMKAFLAKELERRGISREQAAAVPPFGGPIFANKSMPTEPCRGQGVDPSGKLQLGAAKVRYVYVMNDGAANPGVPPDQDLPDGTLWRLDVLASAAAISGELAYATTPEGTFQVQPADQPAPALERGTRYELYALQDVGLPVINCSFTFGEALGTPAAVSGTASAPAWTGASGSTCDAASSRGFGAACSTSGADAEACPCAPAGYCALMPGQTQGYCTATDCKSNPSLCPSGWSCFDLSAFDPSLPAICAKP
jgi:hypothetical protein